MNRKLLKIASSLTDNSYVVVNKGEARELSANSLIPLNLIMWGKLPKDGIYRLCKNNCGSDDCDINKPNPKCVENKTYNKVKCCVYSLEDLRGTFFTYEEFFEIVKQYSKVEGLNE